VKCGIECDITVLLSFRLYRIIQNSK